MGLVKAKRSFYNDAVGTRGQGEVFEVKNAELCNQLEKAGYVEKAEGDQAQANQEQMQEKIGKKQALTNEAVSLAHHEQNQQANQQTQNVEQELKQKQQNQQQQQQNQHQEQQQRNEQATAATPKQTGKKATEK